MSYLYSFETENMSPDVDKLWSDNSKYPILFYHSANFQNKDFLE